MNPPSFSKFDMIGRRESQPYLPFTPFPPMDDHGPDDTVDGNLFKMTDLFFSRISDHLS